MNKLWKAPPPHHTQVIKHGASTCMIREQGAPVFQRLLSDIQEMEPSREQPRDWESFAVITRPAAHGKGFYRPVSFMSGRCRMSADWSQQCTYKAQVRISCLDLAKMWVEGVTWGTMNTGLPWWLRWWRILLTMQETRVPSLSWEDALEQEMAALSSVLARETPWTEEPGWLPSLGSRRVGHDWATKQDEKTSVETTWWAFWESYFLLLRMFKTFHNAMIYKCEQNLHSWYCSFHAQLG